MVSMAETVVDKLVGKLAVREGRGRLKKGSREHRALEGIAGSVR